jgi:hypothetical protein
MTLLQFETFKTLTNLSLLYNYDREYVEVIRIRTNDQCDKWKEDINEDTEPNRYLHYQISLFQGEINTYCLNHMKNCK